MPMAASVRRAVRGLVTLSPRPLRHRWYRTFLPKPDELPADLVFKVAQGRDELEQAFAILYDNGSPSTNPSGFRMTLFQTLPLTTILVAKLGDQVIGTVSLVRDGRLRLPMESTFNLEEQRSAGMRLAEVSCLAVHRSHRRDHGAQVFFPLACYLIDYCLDYAGITDLVMAVPPNMQDLYEAIFSFAPIPKARTENAVALWLDLSTYRNVPKRWGADCPHFKFPERPYFKAWDPAMKPSLLDYFSRQAGVLANLNERQIAEFQEQYGGHPEFSPILTRMGLRAGHARQEPRFRVHCPAVLRTPDGEIVNLEIEEVSLQGCRAWAPCMLSFKETFEAKIQLGPGRYAQVKVEPVWADERTPAGSKRCRIGFKLVQHCAHWVEFLRYLRQDFSDAPPVTKR